MSGSPGQQALAPYEVSATDTSSSSTTTTTEIVTDTVVASVVDGETYVISTQGIINASVAGDEATVSIRLTNASGTRLASSSIYLPTTTGVYNSGMFASWTATSTGSQTFVATIFRRTGTGNVRRYASATAQAEIRVRREW